MEVGTIIYDIGTINVKFYLLEIRYSHGYRRIIPIYLHMNEWLAVVVHMQFEKSNLTFYTWRDQRPHKIKYKMKKKQQEEKLKDKLMKTR